MNNPDTFAKAAEYYTGRTAYSDKFFEKLARALNICQQSKILDLACGGGEVSYGLSRYAQQVTGIDVSAAMLRNATARKIPNATFQQQDLNQSPLTTGSKVDFVTIGRAIQYLDAANLKQTLECSLKPGGLVIVCGAGLGKETVWLPLYKQISRKVREKQSNPDFHGMQKMQSIGFSYQGTIGHTVMARYGIDDVIKHALSYSSQTEAILENIDSFSAELERNLAPYRQADGTFAASENSWGHVFRSAG